MLKSIKYVAVITPHYREFKEYSEDNKCIGTEYKHIQKLDDFRGVVFTRRVLLHGWRNMYNINQILAVLSTRIKM